MPSIPFAPRFASTRSGRFETGKKCIEVAYGHAVRHIGDRAIGQRLGEFANCARLEEFVLVGDEALDDTRRETLGITERARSQGDPPFERDTRPRSASQSASGSTWRNSEAR